MGSSVITWASSTSHVVLILDTKLINHFVADSSEQAEIISKCIGIGKEASPPMRKNTNNIEFFCFNFVKVN
jgi:hypothetical protein